MTNIHHHKILILDFGSQYTQLIARRVREIGVYCELWAWDVTEQQIRDFNPTGIILSGGPESTTEENSPRAPEYVFNAGVPVLGICYGMQTMAMQLGGLTETSDHREFGYASVLMENSTALFSNVVTWKSSNLSFTPIFLNCAKGVSGQARCTRFTSCGYRVANTLTPSSN